MNKIINGKNILHYNILEKLGQGGMGIVYLAEDTKLERKVAIKFLPSHIAGNSDQQKRFEIEAKAAAALNHPNISTIHAIEESEDQVFLVMEYIEGKELKQLISDDEKLTNENALKYARQIAEGLQVAHKKGIVHRDIKSSNIMVSKEGNVKIMDFGLAKVRGSSQLTKIGTTIGTVAYMSPEQARGEDIDQRSDIWSFGVVLYEMLSGELPFKGEYEQAVIYGILNEKPADVKNLENFPALKKILNKALKKNPEERYTDLSEIIADLETKKTSVNPPKLNKIANIKKLAILPFSNTLDDPQTNFLGFALADQIIGSMAYSKNVQVRSSSSIRKFQGQIVDIQNAGSELNVNFVLAGNYLKQDDTIRLNIELIDLESEEMIWREAIETKYQNVFELQDMVTQKAVQGLKVQFSPEERERMKPETPQNPAAYDFYLRAIAYPYTVEGNKLAIELLNESIGRDPLYANAFNELGSRYTVLSQVGSSTITAKNKAEQALLKALSLKNDLLPALANLGLLYTDSGRHEESHEMLIRALKINPNSAWLHFALSYHYRYIGFLEESEEEADLALAIDPNNPRFRSSIIAKMFLGKYESIINTFDLDIDSPFTLNHLGEVALRTGQKELALSYFEQSLRVEDEIGEFYFAASFVEYIKGNLKKAKEYNLQRELEDPADSENYYEIARLYGLFNQVDDCYRALKKSIERGYVSYPSMQNDSFLDSVRETESVKRLLKQVYTIYSKLRQTISTGY